MRESASGEMKCGGAAEAHPSTSITRGSASRIRRVARVLESLKMGQVRQYWARRTHSGLLLALMLLVIGPSMSQAVGPENNGGPVSEAQKLARSNFTQKFSDKVQISKDTFVSVEEALQLLKSRNKVPHIKFGHKLEKVQLIGSSRSENKNPQLRSSHNKNLARSPWPSEDAEDSAKNPAFLKSLNSGKTVTVNGETGVEDRSEKASEGNYGEKRRDSHLGYSTLGAKRDVKNIPQFVGTAREDVSDGDDLAGSGIRTESPPSWEADSVYRDCAVFVDNELVGVQPHGSSWSEGDDRCAICQCDDGEQRCYYHYCNGPELGFITPPSAETPSAREDADGSRGAAKGNADGGHQGATSAGTSAGGARSTTAPSEASQRKEQSTKSPSTETKNEAIERLLAFDDDDDYEYDLQSSGMSPWYYSDDEDGYFEDYDQDDYGDHHENYDSSLDLLPDVNTIHDHGYELSNGPLDFSSVANSAPEAPGLSEDSSDGSRDCESDCGTSCPYGYKITPGASCPTCKCLKCRPLADCRLYCAAGYRSDSHGCPTCACATDVLEDLNRNETLLNPDPNPPGQPRQPTSQDRIQPHHIDQENTQPEFNHNRNPAANVDVHHTLGDITATHKFDGNFDASFAGENNDVIDHDAATRVNAVRPPPNFKKEQNFHSDRRGPSNAESATADKTSSFVEIDEHFKQGSTGFDVGDREHDVANIPDGGEPAPDDGGDVLSTDDDDDVESNDIHAGNGRREKSKHANGKKRKDQDPHNHFYDNAFNILKEDEVSILRDDNPDDNRDFHIDSLRLTPDVATDIFLKKNSGGDNDFDDDDDNDSDDDDSDDDEDDGATKYGTYHRKYSEDAVPRSTHDFFAPVNYDLDFVTTEDDIVTTVARDEVDKQDKKSSLAHDKNNNCSHAAPHHCQDPSGTQYPAGAVWYRGACTVCRCYGAGYAECTITQCSTAPAPAHCAPPAPGQCCPRCYGVPDSGLAALQSSVTGPETDSGPRDSAGNGPSDGPSDGPGNGPSDDSAFASQSSTVKEAVRSDVSSICVVVLVLVAVTSVGAVVALRYWRRYHSAKYDIAATITCEEAQKLRPVKLSSSEQISDGGDVLEPLRPAKCV